MTVPSTASGVIVALGFDVETVKACFGIVKLIVANVQDELFAPLTIDLGDISS